MRIAKALAQAGIASRRRCETFVTAGEVRVNGRVVHDLGRQVDPAVDRITYRGRTVSLRPCNTVHVYYMLHKPKGYTTTAADPHAQRTVFDLLPTSLGRTTRDGATRVFPVGRLDRDSTGLLLFTNDGVLANQLTHPRYSIDKWYDVTLDRPITSADAQRLLRGVRLTDGMARARQIAGRNTSRIRLLLREGRKREVRRMCDQIGYEVRALRRTSFGPLQLGSLRSGAGRYLQPTDCATLQALIS
jgi:23S rRNA pseudouridine2605 synthase